MKVVENAMNEVVRDSVMKCAEWYGFNGEEALRMLEEVQKVENRKKTSKQSELVLPFVSELVVETGCQGLCYNRGLFTQCPKAKKESGLYCKTCEKEALGSESGKPLLGTIAERMKSDVMEFRDPKGRAPVAYSRIMSQMGLSRETVEAEAVRLGVTIPEEHFAAEKKRGRPPVEKKRKAQAETVEDLLSRMVTESDESYEVNSQADTVLMSENEDAEDAEDAESAEKEAISAAETFLKETAQKAEKEATKAAQKAEKEAKQAALAAEKEAKQAVLAAEKEAKQAALAAEKEAKLAAQAAEKAEKEAKAAALAAEKEAKAAALAAEKEAKAAKLAAEKEAKAAKLAAEKEAKAAALAAEKEAKPKAQKGEKEAKPKAQKEAKSKATSAASEASAASSVAPSVVSSVAPVEAESKPKKVTVTRITIEGVEYLKTAENLLYNPQTKEEMGIYDPESKTIKPLPEESDDELDEEDYESDAN